MQFYVRVNDDKSLEGAGPGTGLVFHPLKSLLKTPEQLSLYEAVEGVCHDKSLSEVKDYVVREFESKGFAFKGELPNNALG